MSGAQSQKGRVRIFNPRAVSQGLRGAPGRTQPRTGPSEDHEESPICGRGGPAVPAALPARRIFCSIVSSPAGPLMAQPSLSTPRPFLCPSLYSISHN